MIRVLSSRSHQRVIMLGLIFMISLGFFHSLWLWQKLEDDESFLFSPLEWSRQAETFRWKQDMHRVLECHRLPRHGGSGGDASGEVVDTARALFCLIAKSRGTTTHGDDQEAFLEIYRLARRTISEPATLRHLLQQAVPIRTSLLADDKFPVELWAPDRDQGLLQALNGLRNITGWPLGPGTFMVDVGSHLGLLELLVQFQFPGTSILSLEPAPGNWLYQLLNLAHNLDREALRRTTVLNVAVTENDNATIPLFWQHYATGSCTSWLDERAAALSTCFTTQARNLDVLLTEQSNVPAAIDVLMLDCQGCEYNVMPTLSTPFRFAAGGLHWSYLADLQKPSSARAQKTHEMLCKFRDFRRNARECCAFASIPAPAVDDPSNNRLCDDFEDWARQNKLHDIPNDTPGWQHEKVELVAPAKEPKDEKFVAVKLTDEELKLVGGDDVL